MKPMHRPGFVAQNYRAGGSSCPAVSAPQGACVVARWMAVLVGVLIALTASPAPAHAASYTTPGGLTVESPQGDRCWDYSEDERILFITADAAGQNPHIKVSGTTSTERIVIMLQGIGQVVDITFRDLHIDASSLSGAAVQWRGGRNSLHDSVSMIRLTLEGKSSLVSPSGYAGFQKDVYHSYKESLLHNWNPGSNILTKPEVGSTDPWLHILGNGTLEATGGDGGAGIGGGEGCRALQIAIGSSDGSSNPTVVATGGNGAAGIGGGRGAYWEGIDESKFGPKTQGTQLYFYSGTVTATGGTYAAGIGGGQYGRGENIWISGGEIKAVNGGDNGNAGAAIGAGAEAGAHNIFVTGGTVHAVAQAHGGFTGGAFQPAYPFGDGSWCNLHFLNDPLLSISGGSVDLSGSWGHTTTTPDGTKHTGVWLDNSRFKNARVEISGGSFGGDYGQPGRTGIGKVYGFTPVADHIVLHNEDPATSERFPWKVEKGMNEFVATGSQTYADGVLTTTGGAATISMRPGVHEAVYDRVVLSGNDTQVTLSGLTITRPSDATGEAGVPVLVAKGGSTTQITLTGINTLKASGEAAGLQLNGTISRNPKIEIDGDGSLEVRGSGGGAGIGGSKGSECGTIQIDGGNIAAYSDGGAAIGSGAGKDTAGDRIILNGGRYADANATLGPVGVGKVYGHSPNANKKPPLSVARNTDPATKGEYPFEIVQSASVGSSLVVYGSGVVQGTDWELEGAELHIKSGKPMTVAMAPDAQMSGIRIVVDEGIKDGAKLTLFDLDLNMRVREAAATEANGGSAIVMHSPATISLSGANEIATGVGGAAIANRSNQLIINGDGSLEAQVRGGAAAIGGDVEHPNGEFITIASGTITVSARGENACAIGAGTDGEPVYWPGDAQEIAITGGRINVIAYGADSPIGGWPAPGAKGPVVTITGGYFADVDAVPGGHEAGVVYDVPMQKGSRLIKTRDEDLAEKYPFEVIPDARAFAVKTPDGKPAEEYVDYTYLDGKLTILSSNDMVIEGVDPAGSPTADRIRVKLASEDETARLTLRDIHIASKQEPSIELEQGGCDVMLEGSNGIAAQGCEVFLSHGRPVTFDGEGSLTVLGGYDNSYPWGSGNGVLVGGGASESANITFLGGNFEFGNDNSYYGRDVEAYVGSGKTPSIDVRGGSFKIIGADKRLFGTRNGHDGVSITGGAYAKGSTVDHMVYGMPIVMGYHVVEAKVDAEAWYRVERAPLDLVIEGEDLEFGSDWVLDVKHNQVILKTVKPVRISMADELGNPSTDKITPGYTTTRLVSDPGAGQVASVTLDGVKIEGDTEGAPAVEIASGDMNLELAAGSVNKLRGGDNMAALQTGGHAITITSDAQDPGELKAKGGVYSPAIGAGYNGRGAASLTVQGGRVIAIDGERGAALGAGYQATDPVAVTIDGGMFDLRASGGTSYIGAGDKSSSQVEVRLNGGMYADADASFSTGADDPGMVYGLVPAAGTAVVPTDDAAFPAKVLPVGDSTLVPLASEVAYDGLELDLADFVRIPAGTDSDAVTVEWQTADGEPLEKAPSAAGVYKLKISIAEHECGGVFFRPSELVVDVTVAPRVVGLAWSGLTQVVGDAVEVAVTLDGVVPGDDVRAVLEGDRVDTVGTYTARVTGLAGDDAANYAIADDAPRERAYTVSQSGSVVTADADREDGSYEYGDAIKIEGAVAATGKPVADAGEGGSDVEGDGGNAENGDDGSAAASGAPAAAEGDVDAPTSPRVELADAPVELRFGDRVLGTSQLAVDGSFAFEISSVDAGLPLGAPAVLDVLYAGNADVYEGAAQVIVTVDRREIVAGMFAPIEGVMYSGSAHEPQLEIVDGLLTKDDIAVSYKKNLHAGTAKAVVTGMGNFAGTVELPFEIEKAELSYAVEPKWVSVGDKLDVVKAPAVATGVNGETFTGTLTWDVSDDYSFAGNDGDTVILGWTFTLDETADDYESSVLKGTAEFTVKVEPGGGEGGNQGGGGNQGDGNGGDESGNDQSGQGDEGNGNDGGQGDEANGSDRGDGGSNAQSGPKGSSCSVLPGTGDASPALAVGAVCVGIVVLAVATAMRRCAQYK